MILRFWVFAGTLLWVWGCGHTVTQKDRDFAKIRVDIGLAELSKGRIRDALPELLSAVELDPESYQAHNALGLVFHTLGRKDDALGHYRQAVALKPDFSEAHNNMGVLLLDLGRYDDAIAHFQQALSDILYPTPSFAEGNLGWAHYKKGDVESGVSHLRNAVATNPKFCRGYEWLSRLGLETGDAAMTVSNCARFDRHCLGDETILPTLAKAYVAEMKYYCGLGHLKEGDQAKAREAFSACAEPGGAGFAAKCAESLAGLD